MLWIILGIIVSYLLGSIPFAYVFGRILKGIDIRKFGSGNVGATNAIRVLGKGWGIALLVLDILKGFVTVIFLGDLIKVSTIANETLRILLGTACICGHNWTVFLKFKGGKGIATTFGVLLGLGIKMPGLNFIFILMILTWLGLFFITRIVSIASVLSGIMLPIYMFLSKQSNVLKSFSIIISIFILIRHKSNLKRLLEGKEPRFK